MENGERKEKMTILEKVAGNRAAICAVYIVLAAVFFSMGYGIGRLAVPEEAVAVLDEAVINTDTEVVAEVWYEVCTEDNRLCLYRLRGSDERVELASEEISAGLFPHDDRNELGDGLIFESFEAAQACFEDFVS